MKKNKQLENLTGAVILNQLALNYNESLIYTKFYKHRLKASLNLAIKELMRAEKNEFDKVWEVDPDYTDQVSNNVIMIMQEISKGGFTDMIMLGNIICAFQKDRKKLSQVIDEVLNGEQVKVEQ